MNIDYIIDSIELDHIINLDSLNPCPETIYEKLNEPIDYIKYNNEVIIKNSMKIPLNLNEYQTNPSMNKLYYIISLPLDKEDIISNITCNNKFNMLFEHKHTITDYCPNNKFIKYLLNAFPLINKILLKPYEISMKSSNINIVFPILFMFNTRIKIKIYFDTLDELYNSNIKINYISYTISQRKKLELNKKYIETNSISNNRGMIFTKGILLNDYDLD
jgi:hypothetical protein